MKRLPAILFLLILVFNFVGYRVVISYMQTGSDLAAEKKLDKADYNDAELVSIKTTLNLPYYSSSSAYERAYGSINIKGVVYDYVKRRVYNDTLELLCLPNGAKTSLQAAKNDMAKEAADGQASAPVKKNANAVTVPLPNFCQQLETVSTLAPLRLQNKHYLQNEFFSFADFTERQERPPQAI